MTIEKPITQFTRAGDVAIAYQVFGSGPVDLIYIAGWLHNIDVVWEHPGYCRFLEGLAEHCRVILFDKRGTGMSDRDVGAPTLEERTEDIRAVMAAVGSKKAAIFGISEGGSLTAMFAACYPELVSAIVMIGCFPCRAWKPDWPIGQRRREFEAELAEMEEKWGDLAFKLDWAAPSVRHVPEEQAFWNRLLTQSASPKSAVAITRLNWEIDLRPILPSINVPTLILHPEKDIAVTVEEGRYLAEHIPNARFEFVRNSEHLPWIGDTEGITRQIVGFVTAPPGPRQDERFLATILMTDITASTETAARVGDEHWKQTIETHDHAAARAVARHEGILVKTMGDGLFATFSGPSRAIDCAKDIISDAADLGLKVRAGIHTGECLRRPSDVSGMAVNIAARVLDHVSAGEIGVTGTVKGLVVGSGLAFNGIGTKTLKGVPETWPLYKVASS